MHIILTIIKLADCLRKDFLSSYNFLENFYYIFIICYALESNSNVKKRNKVIYYIFIFTKIL